MKNRTEIFIGTTLVVIGLIILFIVADVTFALVLTTLFLIAIGGGIIIESIDNNHTKFK